MLYLFFLLYGGCFATKSLDIGSSINIFGRFGFMKVSMKVIGESEPWIFREPTANIFEKTENSITNYTDKPEAVFNGVFNMEFCDDVVQLLEAYFKDFIIEQIKDSWKVFAASWSNTIIANHFGVNINHITDNYSFIFVRLSRYKESKKLKGKIGSDFKPRHSVKEAEKEITEGDLNSVKNFIKKYGSHFITSYTLGDSLYQVIVYKPSVYYPLKNRLRKTGISSLRKTELLALYSPFNAEHVGSILSASGDTTVVEWAKSAFKSRSFFFPCYNLMKLYRNQKLLKEFDNNLKTKAIVNLELKSLAAIFKDRAKKNWFIEVISNIMELWDNNMWLLF